MDRRRAIFPIRFLSESCRRILPGGLYRFGNRPPDPTLAALGFLLGSYRFERYRKAKPGSASLVAPDGVDLAEVDRVAGAVALARDLINTPANDLGPDDLEVVARELAQQFGADIAVVTGEALLTRNLPY